MRAEVTRAERKAWRGARWHDLERPRPGRRRDGGQRGHPRGATGRLRRTRHPSTSTASTLPSSANPTARSASTQLVDSLVVMAKALGLGAEDRADGAAGLEADPVGAHLASVARWRVVAQRPRGGAGGGCPRG